MERKCKKFIKNAKVNLSSDFYSAASLLTKCSEYYGSATFPISPGDGSDSDLVGCIGL